MNYKSLFIIINNRINNYEGYVFDILNNKIPYAYNNLTYMNLFLYSNNTSHMSILDSDDVYVWSELKPSVYVLEGKLTEYYIRYNYKKNNLINIDCFITPKKYKTLLSNTNLQNIFTDIQKIYL
tara:strand:+ start:558 stop:929 length:372 start_codon:yes stop_codon:yes gene_type:complete